MALFHYIVTIEYSGPPTDDAKAAIREELESRGFNDWLEEGADDGKLRVAGSTSLRGDQISFELRDKLDEIWKGTTVVVSEPEGRM